MAISQISFKLSDELKDEVGALGGLRAVLQGNTALFHIATIGKVLVARSNVDVPLPAAAAVSPRSCENRRDLADKVEQHERRQATTSAATRAAATQAARVDYRSYASAATKLPALVLRACPTFVVPASAVVAAGLLDAGQVARFLADCGSFLDVVDLRYVACHDDAPADASHMRSDATPAAAAAAGLVSPSAATPTATAAAANAGDDRTGPGSDGAAAASSQRLDKLFFRLHMRHHSDPMAGGAADRALQGHRVEEYDQYRLARLLQVRDLLLVDAALVAQAREVLPTRDVLHVLASNPNLFHLELLDDDATSTAAAAAAAAGSAGAAAANDGSETAANVTVALATVASTVASAACGRGVPGAAGAAAAAAAPCHPHSPLQRPQRLYVKFLLNPAFTPTTTMTAEEVAAALVEWKELRRTSHIPPDRELRRKLVRTLQYLTHPIPQLDNLVMAYQLFDSLGEGPIEISELIHQLPDAMKNCLPIKLDKFFKAYPHLLFCFKTATGFVVQRADVPRPVLRDPLTVMPEEVVVALAMRVPPHMPPDIPISYIRLVHVDPEVRRNIKIRGLHRILTACPTLVEVVSGAESANIGDITFRLKGYLRAAQGERYAKWQASPAGVAAMQRAMLRASTAMGADSRQGASTTPGEGDAGTPQPPHQQQEDETIAAGANKPYASS